MVYAGTAVTRGRGRAIVTATGAATELGEIAGLTEQAKPPPTPLQRRVGALTRLMVGFGVVVTLALGGAMLAAWLLARRGVPGRSLRGRRGGPRGTRGDGHDRPSAGCARDGGARRDRSPADRGRDARERDGDRLRQDGHADRESASPGRGMACARTRRARAAGRGGLWPRPRVSSARKESCRVVGDPVDAALALAAHERGLTSRGAARGSAPRARAPFRLAAQTDDARLRGGGCGASHVRQGGTRGHPRALDGGERRCQADRSRRGGLGFEGAEGARRRRATAPRRGP